MQLAALAPVSHQPAHAPARIPGTRIATMRQSFRQLPSWRLLSHAPETAVYGGGAARPGQEAVAPARPVTLATLRGKHRRGEPITMVTAYDYSSAVHVDSAGIDLILVGDSAAMVAHGHDNTLPISLDLILEHCRAVVRGAPRPLIVGDLPFGSYESSPAQAVESAVRLVKEGGVNAVKMEGGAPSRVSAAKAIVEAGIAVMGHVGLTPQAISALGGFRAQGKTVDSALKVVEAALALQDAGCFAVVLECVPAPVAAAATTALQIPTIGIGAGPLCSGQVLVYHDLLGMFESPAHSKVTPKFCKQFGNVGAVISKALTEYREEVEARTPSTRRTRCLPRTPTPSRMCSRRWDSMGLRQPRWLLPTIIQTSYSETKLGGGRKPQEMNTNGVLSASGAAV
ncbi:unnamed protein product [Urochloa humidicola]